MLAINPIPLVKPRPCSPKPEKQGRGLTIEFKVSLNLANPSGPEKQGGGLTKGRGLTKGIGLIVNAG